MKAKKVMIIILFICILTTNSQALLQDDYDTLVQPPYDKIKEIEIIDLKPAHKMSFKEYDRIDSKYQKENDGVWSTVNHNRLDSLNISVKSSSTLKGYMTDCLFDKKIETAWVEGVKGDGLDEWLVILLQAKKDSVTTTPFTINEFAMIPGYAKSEKTWGENNRVKTALLIVYTPEKPQSFDPYMVYRLHFEDWKGLQIFNLGDDLLASEYMIKKAWLIIEEVYKGSKYSDTCISEIVFSGGFSS